MRTQAIADGGVQSPTGEAAQTADQGSLAKLVYTINELCQVVGISRATVYKEIKEQRLRVRKVGKRTLVPVDEVRAWLKI
jgi:excisionase family DNA binding protein